MIIIIIIQEEEEGSSDSTSILDCFLMSEWEPPADLDACQFFYQKKKHTLKNKITKNNN